MVFAWFSWKAAKKTTATTKKPFYVDAQNENGEKTSSLVLVALLADLAAGHWDNRVHGAIGRRNFGPGSDDCRLVGQPYCGGTGGWCPINHFWVLTRNPQLVLAVV